MNLRALFVLVIFFTPDLVIAESLSFAIGKDKVKIEISVPESYCLLDKSKPSDKHVLTTFDLQAEGKHRRLAFMVNCNQLLAWRSGDLLTFSDFGYILLPEEFVNQNSDKALDQFLNDMVDEIGRGRKNIIRNRGNGYLESYVAQTVVELDRKSSIDLGLIHRDNLALYTASLDKITTEIGRQNLIGKVTAITQVNNKPLFFYLIRDLGNIETIAETEQVLSKWINSVHLVN